MVGLEGSEQPLTPEQIIYRQIERIHLLRANKLSAMESIFLLSGALKPLRTEEYDKKTKELVKNGSNMGNEAFYEWYEILIEILSKNGYWLVQRQYLGWED